MTVKFFWRPGCPKCPPAKELSKKLLKDGFNIKLYNLEDTNGLAEATLHGVMSTPTIVVTDDNDKEINSWRGETPAEVEIKKYFK
jgi:glutaredoxin